MGNPTYTSPATNLTAFVANDDACDISHPSLDSNPAVRLFREASKGKTSGPLFSYITSPTLHKPDLKAIDNEPEGYWTIMAKQTNHHDGSVKSTTVPLSGSTCVRGHLFMPPTAISGAVLYSLVKVAKKTAAKSTGASSGTSGTSRGSLTLYQDGLEVSHPSDEYDTKLEIRRLRT